MEFEGIAVSVQSKLKQSTDVEHSIVLVTPDKKVVALGHFLNKRLKVKIDIQEEKPKKSKLEKL